MPPPPVLYHLNLPCPEFIQMEQTLPWPVLALASHIPVGFDWKEKEKKNTLELILLKRTLKYHVHTLEKPSP